MKFKLFFILIAVSLVGCQAENSFSGDEERYSSTGGDASLDTCDGRLAAVRAIFQSSCASCHPTYVSYSYRDWIDVNFVESADHEASPIFYRLRGSGVGNNQNMPPTGQLTSAEISDIQEWITEMEECL